MIAMRVHLPPLDGPYTSLASDIFVRLATFSSQHVVCDADEDPDIVLFTQAHQYLDDWRLRVFRNHPLRTSHPGRCFIYDERSFPWCSLPGLYVSMPSHSFSPYQRAVPYAWLDDAPFSAVRAEPTDLLFSFAGAPTHPARRPIFELSHPRGLVEDTSGFLFNRSDAPNFVTQRQRFVDLVARSKFVLCPRGHATSSIRLYEVMAAGRIPVIISDAWVPPKGPDWDSFAIWCRESEVADLPRRLEREEATSETRMRSAAEAYDQHFAESVRFDKMIDLVAELLPIAADFPKRGVHNRQHYRAALRALRGRAVEWRGKLAEVLPSRPDGDR